MSVGRLNYNLALGDKRASAVKETLLAGGVSSRMSGRLALVKRSRSVRSTMSLVGSRTAAATSVVREYLQIAEVCASGSLRVCDRYSRCGVDPDAQWH